MEITFFVLLFLCFYGYVGYPLLLLLITPCLKRYQHLPEAIENPMSVSILVAAYNEERVIADKLQSLLNQNYPSECFDIWVLNDGSDDRTSEIVRQFSERHSQIHLLDLPRGGKATALNTGVVHCKHEIIVFSDADNEWPNDTLLKLIAPFSITSVGAVSGQLTIRSGTKKLGLGDKLYRQYESIIRRCENRTGSAVSADGGIFAIRRALYIDLPQDVTDDFYISTGSVLQGYDLVYQSSALAYDVGVEEAKRQFRRRVRVTVRGMTSLWKRRALFNPVKYGWYSWCLLSHKFIRRLVPFFILLLLPINLFILEEHILYQYLFALQITGYLAALLGMKGWFYPKKVGNILGFLLISSMGMAIGILQFLSGKRYTFWSPEQNR